MTNRAAISLYQGVLGYEILGTDKAYYADKEDAYDMRMVFRKEKVAALLDEKNEENKTVQLMSNLLNAEPIPTSQPSEGKNAERNRKKREAAKKKKAAMKN